LFGDEHTHTGCPGRNVPEFWRMFFKLKYNDLTKKHLYPKLNGYEIMARE
jgi:hypothetical protein